MAKRNIRIIQFGVKPSFCAQDRNKDKQRKNYWENLKCLTLEGCWLGFQAHTNQIQTVHKF